MPYTFHRGEKVPKTLTFERLFDALNPVFPRVTPLAPKGNRPLQMYFEDELNALIFFHLEEHDSARHLIQTLQEDDFARRRIAPEKGIGKSSFSEAINNRGLPQMLEVFQYLRGQAIGLLPNAHPELGSLVAIDGSLIEATLSMIWADYRKGAKKAKVHLGFNINQGIPQSLILTSGKSAEYMYVEKLLEIGQTGVMDRYYQCHKAFDAWQEQDRFFICRIKANTTKTVVLENPILAGGPIFYDAIVQLGTAANQTQKALRLIGYRVGNQTFWIATNRLSLSAEQIALAYKLRWDIECFFAWWKRHMRVYHLIARSPYGLLMQILAGLITYLLVAIYCHTQFDQKVNIERFRKIRIQIHNELRAISSEAQPHEFSDWDFSLQAIT
ncbi:IS4 family transposase [Deltaproteobacteria bacterium TL4]